MILRMIPEKNVFKDPFRQRESFWQLNGQLKYRKEEKGNILI